MAQGNASALTSGGEALITHNPGNGEHQVLMIAGADGHIKGSKPTFSVIYKLADATATGQAVSLVFTANQVRQLATLHHLASATKRKTIKRIELHIAATAATILVVQLVRITVAPATQNGVSAVVPMDPAFPSSGEAVALVNPTTLGAFAADQPLFMQEFNLAANAANARPGQDQPIVIVPPQGMPADDDFMEPVIRAGLLEGYAILLKSTAAVTLKASARIIFTEE